MLHELRATNPRPPMVSRLDLGEEAEEGADLGPPESPTQPEPRPETSAACPTCVQLLQRAKMAEEQLDKLRTKYRLLNRRHRRYKNKYPKRPAVANPMATTSSSSSGAKIVPPDIPHTSSMGDTGNDPTSGDDEGAEEEDTEFIPLALPDSPEETSAGCAEPLPSSQPRYIEQQGLKEDTVSTTPVQTSSSTTSSAPGQPTLSTASAMPQGTTGQVWSDKEHEGKDEPGPAPSLLARRQITLSASLEPYLQEYLQFLQGVKYNRKQRENALSRTTRVKALVEYMAAGKKELWTWNFLNNGQRVDEWTRYLLDTG